MKAWIVVLVGAALVGGCGGGSRDGDDDLTPGGMRSDIVDRDGDKIGTVTLEDSPSGMLIRVRATDLPPGQHGMHVHDRGRCDRPSFESAGGHFNPFDRRHGMLSAQGKHAGDLPNVTVSEDGNLEAEVVTTDLSLADSRLFDADGAALVIHEAADDHRTDPTGNSGARIACAALRRR